MAKAGRPKLQLDENQIKELAKIQCTMTEIAAVMRCSTDTLEHNYRQIIEEGREDGKASLRHVQYRKALEGNTALLIWLGKHYLKQKDEIALSTAEPEVRELLKKWERGITHGTNPNKYVSRQEQKASAEAKKAKK